MTDRAEDEVLERVNRYISDHPKMESRYHRCVVTHDTLYRCALHGVPKALAMRELALSLGKALDSEKEAHIRLIERGGS